MDRDHQSDALSLGDEHYELHRRVHMFNPYDMEEYAALMTLMSASIESFDNASEEECTEAQRKRLRRQLRKQQKKQRTSIPLGQAIATSTEPSFPTKVHAQATNATTLAKTRRKKKKRNKPMDVMADVTGSQKEETAPASTTVETTQTDADIHGNAREDSSCTRSGCSDTKTLKKALITPDGRYEYLGEGVGFQRLKSKRKRGHIQRNNLSKKWAIAMRRHWNSAKKDAAMAAITIKRCDMSEVRQPLFHMIFCTTVRHSGFFFNLAGVSAIRGRWCVYHRRFF
jgi:hypothetical protein